MYDLIYVSFNLLEVEVENELSKLLHPAKESKSTTIQ